MKKQAVINVAHPENIVPLVTYLSENGWEIFATEKNAAMFSENGINVNVEYGLHQDSEKKIFYDLLDSVANTGHHTEIENINRIREVHIVFVDLLPDFKITKDLREAISCANDIDERSVMLTQTAIKNYQNVIVLSDYKDCNEVLIRLRTDNFSDDYKIHLAAKAMSMIASYDYAAANSVLQQTSRGSFPHILPLPYQKAATLVSGANKQQSAALYYLSNSIGNAGGLKKLQGKKPSFDTIANMSTAWKAVFRFSKFIKNPHAVKSTTFDGNSYTIQFTPAAGTVFTVVVVCNALAGASLGASAMESCEKTFSKSNVQYGNAAFACSSVIDEDAAKIITQHDISTVIAPSYTQEARAIFESNPNIYVYNSSHEMLYDYEFVSVDGGLIIQSTDGVLFKSWQIVTHSRPNQEQADAMAFGMTSLMSAKYEASALINNMTVSNIWCNGMYVPYSFVHADSDNQKYVLVCNSILRFNEAIKEILEKNVTAIIQTGGAENDEDFINFCNERNIAMVFTGITHISI